MLRSGMGFPPVGSFQHLVDAGRSFLAMGYGVHNFAAAVNAISAGEIARIAGLHGLVHNDAAVLEFQIRDKLQEIELALLAQSFHHHADLQTKLRARHWDIPAPPTTAFSRGLSAQPPHPTHVPLTIV